MLTMSEMHPGNGQEEEIIGRKQFCTWGFNRDCLCLNIFTRTFFQTSVSLCFFVGKLMNFQKT